MEINLAHQSEPDDVTYYTCREKGRKSSSGTENMRIRHPFVLSKGNSCSLETLYILER